jgi:hypothetical protein
LLITSLPFRKLNCFHFVTFAELCHFCFVSKGNFSLEGWRRSSNSIVKRLKGVMVKIAY